MYFLDIKIQNNILKVHYHITGRNTEQNILTINKMLS